MDISGFLTFQTYFVIGPERKGNSWNRYHRLNIEMSYEFNTVVKFKVGPNPK